MTLSVLMVVSSEAGSRHVLRQGVVVTVVVFPEMPRWPAPWRASRSAPTTSSRTRPRPSTSGMAT
eukprot:1412849-Pyramimonas_sp.AAC.1